MKRKLLFMMLCIVGVLSMSAQFTSGGKYYLQNVSTGEYWGAGDDTNWGTRAMLVEHPQYVLLISNDDGTYKMETQVTNGGTSYYFNGDYMDNGSPVSLTFTQSGDYYTIANGTNYYGAGGSSSVISENIVEATSSAALWKIYTEDEMDATLNEASVDNPVDATFKFLDPGFGRNNRNYTAWTLSGNITNLNIGRQGTDKNNNYGCGESWHSTFSLMQSATVPNGTYKIETRAFYRQDGSDNDHLPVIIANEESVVFPLRTGSEASMQAAQQSFQAGNYAIEPIFVYVSNGSLELGVKLEGNTSLWCIWDGFDVTYYGDVSVAEVVLSKYVHAYQQALTAAQSYLDKDMFDDDKASLSAAVNDNTLNLNDPSLTKEQLTTAAANLNAAAAAAKIAAAQYAYYSSVSNAISGQTNVDLTSLTPDQNWGFETGNLTSWTSTDGGRVANNGNFSEHVGTWFVEKWRSPNDSQGVTNGVLTHDALVLPAGVYTISVNAQNVEQYNNNAAGTGYFLYANNDKVEIGAAGTYTVLTNLAEDRSELVIKMAIEGCTGNWISCDAFKITYVGEDFPPYTLVTGKMNNDVAAAQTAAETAFIASKTNDNYNALLSAIAAAQASHDAYTRLAESLNIANNVLAATNVYTADEFSSLNAILQDAQTGYDEGTITTDNANATANQIIGNGWHGNYKLSDLLISAWDAQNDW